MRTAETTKTAAGHLISFNTTAEELSKSVGAATMMTSEAWRLWDLRRVKQH